MAEARHRLPCPHKRKSLISRVSSWLTDIKKDPDHSSDTEQKALFNYNFLRELLQEDTVSSWKDIDQSWLDLQGYQFWKETEQYIWKKRPTMTLLKKVDFIVTTLNSYLYQLEQTGSLDRHSQLEALYIYNFIRELLNRTKAKSFSEIDQKWFSQVKKEIIPLLYAEEKKYSAPTLAQAELRDQAQKLIKIEDEILAFSYAGAGASGWVNPGIYSVALCKTPDINIQLGVLYHELGHIVHKDMENRADINIGVKTHEEFLNDPSFKADIDRITKYLQLGKKAFDKSTPVGKHIVDILSRYPELHFWTQPRKKTLRNKISYLRGNEQRADLFEIEQLLANHQLDAILQGIADYAFGSSDIPVIAHPWEDHHPSDFERALYRAGFLVDKGIDINKVFQRWYATGTCKPMPPDTLDVLFSMPAKSQGARDLTSAYKLWQAEQDKEKYNIWKEEQQAIWQKKGITTVPEQVRSLLSDTNSWLAVIKRDPDHSEDSEQKTLYYYNFLRELLHENTVSSWQNIDQSWQHEQDYQFWKQEQHDTWQKKEITTLQARARSLLSSLNYWLDDIKKDPNHSSHRERFALFNYNFLRELLHKDTVSSWKDIDLSWANGLRYTFLGGLIEIWFLPQMD